MSSENIKMQNKFGATFNSKFIRWKLANGNIVVFQGLTAVVKISI